MRNYTINNNEAEMINKALKTIANKYKEEAKNAEDIFGELMYTQLQVEYLQLAEKFTYKSTL